MLIISVLCFMAWILHPICMFRDAERGGTAVLRKSPQVCLFSLNASLGNFAASEIENKIQDYGTEVVFPVFGPKQDLHLD